jgi:anti-sigma regulatory factor (Ser/Thr protein kinase)
VSPTRFTGSRSAGSREKVQAEERTEMEKDFRREIAALDDVFRSIDEFLTDRGVDERTVLSTKLVVEELFTNLVRHDVGGLDRVALSLEMEGANLVIRLRDFNVDPFDVSEAEPVDIHLPLAQRKVGGLGIHLVRNLVDELRYDYDDRTLSVTAIKNLEQGDV